MNTHGSFVLCQREEARGPIFPIFLPHFRLYEVVSLHMCVLPYRCRKILEMLLKLMKLCDIMGDWPAAARMVEMSPRNTSGPLTMV